MRTAITCLSLALLLCAASNCQAQDDFEDIPPPLPVPAASYEPTPSSPSSYASGDSDSSESNREINAYGFGVSVVPAANRLRVVGVLVGSPAEAAGVKPGDVISKVNDQSADANLLKSGITSVEISRNGRLQTLAVRMADPAEANFTEPTPTLADPSGYESRYPTEYTPRAAAGSNVEATPATHAPQHQTRVHSYSVPRTTYSSPQRYYVTPRYQSQRYYEPPSVYRTRTYGYRPSASIYFRPSPNVTIGIGNGVGVFGYPGYPGPGFYGRGFGYGPGYGLGPGRGRGGVGISVGGVGIRF